MGSTGLGAGTPPSRMAGGLHAVIELGLKSPCLGEPGRTKGLDDEAWIIRKKLKGGKIAARCLI